MHRNGKKERKQTPRGSEKPCLTLSPVLRGARKTSVEHEGIYPTYKYYYIIINVQV